MTDISNLNDLSAYIAERIQAVIGGKIDVSGQSCSHYVKAIVYGLDEDGDECHLDDCCIRISDHVAMSYNTEGDFRILIGNHCDGDIMFNSDASINAADDDEFTFDPAATEAAIAKAIEYFERFKLSVLDPDAFEALKKAETAAREAENAAYRQALAAEWKAFEQALQERIATQKARFAALPNDVQEAIRLAATTARGNRKNKKARALALEHGIESKDIMDLLVIVG